ncbi:MAG: hypothetical protein ACYCWN_11555 [Ferrimicrobium sp.]|uniref:hypothetical protein n=1 Tax=Ferrimicrobium TaxID=121038 RepID=UPI0026081EC3|nr:hypothetical protein [Ferrimicrobium sp.]
MGNQKRPKHPKGGRYTPPKPRPTAPAGNRVYLVLFVLLGTCGALMIILNFLLVLPGSQSGWYTIGGLALLAGAFYAATQYR